MASAQFFEAIKKRRTYYVLTNASPVPDARIEGIVKDAVLHVPSSFNSQTSRVVVLLRTDHARLWDITAESLKPVAPAAQWPTTVKKLESFKAAYGTILYFEDEDAVRGLQKQFPLYQDSFPIWAEVRSPPLCGVAAARCSPRALTPAAHQWHDPVRHLDRL